MRVAMVCHASAPFGRLALACLLSSHLRESRTWCVRNVLLFSFWNDANLLRCDSAVALHSSLLAQNEMNTSHKMMSSSLFSCPHVVPNLWSAIFFVRKTQMEIFKNVFIYTLKHCKSHFHVQEQCIVASLLSSDALWLSSFHLYKLRRNHLDSKTPLAVQCNTFFLYSCL